MTVGELKDFLEDLDDDTEVRLMTQQNYPMEYRVQDCVLRSELKEAEDPEDETDHSDDGEVLYLVEGSQVGYGDKMAWELCQ